MANPGACLTVHMAKGMRVTKPNLGLKRDCPGCGARFYDLHKHPAICPKCGVSAVVSAKIKVAPAPVAAPVVVSIKDPVAATDPNAKLDGDDAEEFDDADDSIDDDDDDDDDDFVPVQVTKE
jgi:ribosomal protein S27AE